MRIWQSSYLPTSTEVSQQFNYLLGCIRGHTWADPLGGVMPEIAVGLFIWRLQFCGGKYTVGYLVTIIVSQLKEKQEHLPGVWTRLSVKEAMFERRG